MCDSSKTHHLMKQLKLNRKLEEKDLHYMPPTMLDGKVQRAVTVSEGILIQDGESTHDSTLESEPHSEEAQDNPVHAKVEASKNEETTNEYCRTSLIPLPSSEHVYQPNMSINCTSLT